MIRRTLLAVALVAFALPAWAGNASIARSGWDRTTLARGDALFALRMGQLLPGAGGEGNRIAHGDLAMALSDQVELRLLGVAWRLGDPQGLECLFHTRIPNLGAEGEDGFFAQSGGSRARAR